MSGYSDSTQLAAIRVAIASVAKDMGLTAGERDYHTRVLEAIGDRIEDAARRRRQAEAAKRDGQS